MVLGLFVLSAALCCGGYFFAKQHFVDMADDFADRRPELEQHAKAVAVAGPEACVVDGLDKAGKCDQLAIRCRVEANISTTLCLEAADVPPEFCTGVPPQDSIIEVSMWGLAECQQRGLAEDGQCPQFLAKTVAAHCDDIRK